MRFQAVSALDFDPVRQVVGVRVCVVDEAAVLDDQPSRVRAVAPGVPAFRRVAGQTLDRRDRARDVIALGRFVDVLIRDPAPAVARDFVAIGEHRLDPGRIALERHGDAEDRHRDAALAKQAKDPPQPRARSILVERFHAHVSHREGLRADDLGQERLRAGVAVKHRALRAFLVVEDELQRDTRTAGPACVGRMRAIADHVARVAICGNHP